MSGGFRSSYGAGPRISAEFTANSGSMAAAGESGFITVTHSIGVAPSVVVGHLEDGAWSHQCGWRVHGKDASVVVFRFANNGPNTAQAVLRFRLIY